MIRVVTTNDGKFREVAAALAPRPVEQLRRTYPEIQADTLEEVVLHALGDLDPELGDVIVDDSGLFVDALSGFPGVYSAHAFKTLGCEGILTLLEGRDAREATFRTCLGLRVAGEEHVVKGECRGRITRAPRGEGGFGFDPIFRPEGHRRTFAEMTVEEKNAVSHRGRALAALRSLLEEPSLEP
jgi:XTP/dITP diphosphohydrolase